MSIETEPEQQYWPQKPTGVFEPSVVEHLGSSAAGALFGIATSLLMAENSSLDLCIAGSSGALALRFIYIGVSEAMRRIDYRRERNATIAEFLKFLDQDHKDGVYADSGYYGDGGPDIDPVV